MCSDMKDVPLDHAMLLVKTIVCCSLVSACALLPVSLSAREGPAPLSDVMRRSPIQLGVQFMTGYRTNYVYRGIELGEQVFEAQAASSLALSNDWSLAGEADFVRAYANDAFSQFTLYGELQYYITDESTIGPSMAAQFYSDTIFRNACEPGLVWRWNPVADWSLSASGIYDTGQKGFYGNVSVTWQPLITESMAWVNTLTVGGAADYLGADGPTDLNLRTGLLIRMGPSFRLHPFIGVTFGVGDRDERSLNAGVWLSWVY